jgi:hypothetical protein
MSLQNLERQGVRGQNLDNKAVNAVLTGLSYTASALTDVLLFLQAPQGQMSQAGCGK